MNPKKSDLDCSDLAQVASELDDVALDTLDEVRGGANANTGTCMNGCGGRCGGVPTQASWDDGGGSFDGGGGGGGGFDDA